MYVQRSCLCRVHTRTRTYISKCMVYCKNYSHIFVQLQAERGTITPTTFCTNTVVTNGCFVRWIKLRLYTYDTFYTSTYTYVLIVLCTYVRMYVSWEKESRLLSGQYATTYFHFYFSFPIFFSFSLFFTSARQAGHEQGTWNEMKKLVELSLAS